MKEATLQPRACWASSAGISLGWPWPLTTTLILSRGTSRLGSRSSSRRVCRSEANDSRPIQFRKHFGLANLHCILGAKIDNIYDALDEIELITQQRKAG